MKVTVQKGRKLSYCPSMFLLGKENKREGVEEQIAMVIHGSKKK